MTYVAQPPAPTTSEREFTVEIRGAGMNDSAEALEKIIAETVAARLGFEVTVKYRPPF